MLNFALVGCGRIARRHSDLLGHSQIAGAQLVAVCDSAFEKAEKIGQQFDVSSYSEMDEMMLNENIDVVVVLTPSGMHAEHVVNLAKYGKDIMLKSQWL